MNKKIIIIIVAAVVVLGGGAAAYFLVFAGGGDKEPVVFTNKYLPGEYMVTNVKGSKHLLKTSIALEIETPKEEMDADTQAALDAKQVEMRDLINTIQREKTLEDLQSDDIKEQLRDEIVAALKSDLEIENLVTLHFNDFVVQ